MGVPTDSVGVLLVFKRVQMKLLSAEYFPIAPTVDTDSLTLITSILVNRQLRDRFDVLNKYSNVRWASGSDPVPTPITTPMGELLRLLFSSTTVTPLSR